VAKASGVDGQVMPRSAANPQKKQLGVVVMTSQVGAARRRTLRRVVADNSNEGGVTPAVPALGLAPAALVERLTAAESGLAFVYGLLDRVVENGSLQDAAIVVDDVSLGRQIFRVGRRAPWDWPLSPLAELPVGLHTIPDHGDDDLDQIVTHLCMVALQLDLLRHDASHDSLTGLLNRRSFDDLLSQASSRSTRYGWPFALALLDLDHFKIINDRLGHDGGDRVLRAIGAALHQSLRAGDIAARVGGDEFALILANSQLQSVDGVVHRLRAALAGILPADEANFSVGVALAPEEAVDVEELYRLADARLYEAKGAR
jgi:diguanylate cyclase (GGDEF)-like protein